MVIIINIHLTDRVRGYIAGFLHGVSAVLIVGWSLKFWMTGLSGAFGPTGIFSALVACVPGFFVCGGLLLGGGQKGEEKPTSETPPP